jgi:phospholipid transport system transporter-binding protein
LKLPARLTMAEAAGALEALRAAPVGGDALRVDAAALATFDSAALALLLQARREARARGRGFELHGAPPGLRQLARLYGVGELLGLEPA